MTYDTPLYNYFDNKKRQYLEGKKEDFILLYNGVGATRHNPLNKEHNYFSDIYNIGGIPVMFDKFNEIITQKITDPYDFVIRVNSSTFINIDRIREELINKTDKVFMGFFEPSWNFISGACIIFSKDVLIKIPQHKDIVNRNTYDDVVIGSIMNFCGIPKTYLDRYNISDQREVPHDNIISEALKFPQIRIRNDYNREVIDVGIWNKIARTLNLTSDLKK